MTTIRAHFDGKAIVPDEAVDLPVNRPLKVQVEAVEQGSGTAEELGHSRLFGVWKDRTDIGDTLEYARQLRKQAETRRHQIDDTAGQ